MSGVAGASLPRIACAALRFPWSDLTASLPRPARHGDIIRLMDDAGVRQRVTVKGAQGFLTDGGRFVDRREAWLIAEAAGQIIGTPTVPGMLFSEDLW